MTLRKPRIVVMLVTPTGVTIAWRKQEALVSIRDLWMNAHGYA